MIELLPILGLFLSLPLGFLLSKRTVSEREIFMSPQYFPFFLWVFAFLSAVFLTINERLALVSIFVFLTILTWSKA